MKKKTDWVFANIEVKSMVGQESSQAVIVNGQWYPSIPKAAQELKIHRTTLMNHLKSNDPKHDYSRYADPAEG
jgi:hypothetical protein